CPEIKPGAGRVVTGTFAREIAGNLLDVTVEGLEAPIGCTTTHPFWSEDRRAFVFADQPRPGERLRDQQGNLRRVISVVPREGRERVYNLEVDVEHVYHVSGPGILVHNASPYRGKPGEEINPSKVEVFRGGRKIKVRLDKDVDIVD